MSDSSSLEKGLEAVAALGVLIGSALFGRVTARREPEADRSTVLPPNSGPITLSNADLDSVRARLLGVEGRAIALEALHAEDVRRIHAQGRRIDVLEADRDKQITSLREEMQVANTKQLNRTLRDLADKFAERADPDAPRARRKDDRRDSNS